MYLDTYIINLKHRTDRLDYITQEIEKISFLNPTIVEGIIDGTKTCFQSHKKCIQLAKDKKLPYVLILEDDATFIEGAENILQDTFNEIQQFEWNMFFLGANLRAPATRISNSLLKLNDAVCAHAYIVNENFYDTILNIPFIFLIDMGKMCDMDLQYANLMYEHNIFMCDPMIAYQCSSHSDLVETYVDYNSVIYDNYLKFKP